MSDEDLALVSLAVQQPLHSQTYQSEIFITSCKGPEVLCGQEHQQPADMHNLGAVACMMCFGRTPHTICTTGELQ